MREYLAFCILISFIGRPTIFGVVLQASQDDYRSGGHDKDTLGQWNSKAGMLPLQTALYLGDWLNTRRRLGGFSLLSTIRCQTSWISPSVENVTIPPTYGIWGRDSSLSSSPPERREVLLSWKTVWYVSG